MAFPYIDPPQVTVGGIQFYGLTVFAGMALGIVTALKLAKRGDVPDRAVGLLIVFAIPMMLVLAHAIDVINYRWSQASVAPGLWFRMYDGVSLMGVLLGVALATALAAQIEKLPIARLADVSAGGMLVAMVLGRIGCAGVHDHIGMATDSLLGVEFPERIARWTFPDATGPVRAYDTGLLDLFVVAPLAAGALFVLLTKKPRPGVVAAVSAIIYGVARFGTDFLRNPTTEPTRLGLTLGQWGCAIMIALGAYGLTRQRLSPPPPIESAPLIESPPP